MTNAHDILYPSKGRTSALVSQGTYFKVRTYETPRLIAVLRPLQKGPRHLCFGMLWVSRESMSSSQVWTDKKWKNPALKELASCTYQFVRLYVSSFAFQAHVQRAQMRAEAERGADGLGSASGTQLFPRGLWIVMIIADEQARLHRRTRCTSTTRLMPRTRYCIYVCASAKWACCRTCPAGI